MSIRLLATKFHTPPRRAGMVERPRLLEQLDAGLREGRKLTIISAPAGYGKTTLIAEWLANLQSTSANSQLKISWLSLDEADNNPMRFICYFLAAFQQADELLDAQAQSMLENSELPPLPNLLDDLLNDLALMDARFLLALDDYHQISNPQIHQLLEYFLDHQPASTQVALITRTDPPLPLARLRARGQMTEIRARDLRFTAEEARAFFSLANLILPENTLSALDERTEGWAVGLQLAALALRNQSDPLAFIETFRGSHRYVLDYLADEVLRQQGEEVDAFLTQTSILERFDAALCDNLTGRQDSQSLIAQLEQANLFIVPLDDERRWYRYHHLFADYLRSLLSKPEQAALYQKAAIWHESQELTTDAVRYALLGNDFNFAAQIIENSLGKNSTWSGGNLVLLSSWLDALPSEIIDNRPLLSLYASYIHYLAGRFEQTEIYLAKMEQALAEKPATPKIEQLLAMAALYHGSIAAVHGNFEQAIEQITSAQAIILPENHLAHARAYFSLGVAYEIANQTGKAVENYLKSSAQAQSAGILFQAVHSLCSAAQVQMQQGCLRLAEKSCQDAIRLIGGARIPPLGLAYAILGSIALERNDLAQANTFLQDGVALSRKGGLTDDMIAGLAVLGKLRGYQGDSKGAQDVIQEIMILLQSFGVARMNILAAAHIAYFNLYQGQVQAAAPWAKEYQAVRAEPLHEFEELTLARFFLKSGALDEIPGILHPLLEKSRDANHSRTTLEVLLLLGLYHQAKGETPAALDWLGKSLKLAEPEGYIRIFLDEGQPLLDLLAKVRRAAPDLVDSILNVKPTPAEPRSALLDRLPDPLSEQELRVLKLIVEGKSNAEIAAALVISIGTAKWHVHNVLQKLGVSNRPQAIARARELGI